MTKRIFRSIALVVLSVVLASMTLVTGVLYSYFSHVQRQHLQTEVLLAAQGISTAGEGFLLHLDAQSYRITWISPDGTVLYDTESDAASMSNHFQREEIQEALATGFGESTRYSETLLERQFYTARLLADGSVVRVSCAQSAVLHLLLGMAAPMVIIILLTLFLSLWLAKRVSAMTVEPLNHLDLEDPLSNKNFDELSPLLHRIATQQRQLRAQEETLLRRQEEFEAITASMSEGLVLLDPRGIILSINGAARRILSAGEESVGHDLVTLHRALSLQQLLSAALEGRHSEHLVQLGGRDYQMDASPVLYEGSVSGAVLLIIDVTDKLGAEQMRREFTANVSHELRSPLHAISGSAELLCSGLVRREDLEQFHRQIYTESQRMIHLVEDIIHLSRLDEGGQGMEQREVDLFTLAREVLTSLEETARRSGVTLQLTGENALLHGVPQLLSAIISNLCDNAVKYNRPGGHVAVDVTPAPDHVTLTVTDDGIGIPPEHQPRVFERFYRVDKSRSKAVGGTGLGLSIVKHAAMIHGAKPTLSSTPGEGTCISLSFPTDPKKED